MRGTSHQGARCYQRIRSQFLTSSRVNTHGRSPECGRRSKARRRSGTVVPSMSALVGTAPGPVGCRVCRLRDLAGVLASSSAASRSCLFFHSLQIMSAIHPRRPPTPTARVVMAATHDRPRPPDKPRCTCSPLTRPSCDAHIICLTFHSSVPLNREPIVLAAAREATCLRPCFGLSVRTPQLPVCSRLSETDSLAL